MSVQKVLIYIDSLTSGGAERTTFYLSKYLVEHDYSVTVMTNHGKERDFYSLDQRVERIVLNPPFENKGYRKLIANIKKVIMARTLFKKEKPDVVIGMGSKNAVVSVLAGLKLSTRVVVAERNFPKHNRVTPPWALLRRLFYRFADAQTAMTKDTVKWLEKHTGAKNAVSIPVSIQWPIPAHSPVLDPDSLFDEDDKLILAVGRLHPVKGFDLLIDAFAMVCEENPDWKLVILGGEQEGSQYRGKLAKKIRENELAEQVYLPGRAGNVGDWYLRADLFVLSSRTEGFPNVLLEAMASGCCCLAFDCETGPGEIIESGTNGILVPSEDVPALAESMRKLMESPELREKLGERSTAVREKYSESSVLVKWEELLQGLA